MVEERTVFQPPDDGIGVLVPIYESLAWYGENLNRRNVGAATEAVFAARFVGWIIVWRRRIRVDRRGSCMLHY